MNRQALTPPPPLLLGGLCHVFSCSSVNSEHNQKDYLCRCLCVYNVYAIIQRQGWPQTELEIWKAERTKHDPPCLRRLVSYNCSSVEPTISVNGGGEHLYWCKHSLYFNAFCYYCILLSQYWINSYCTNIFGTTLAWLYCFYCWVPKWLKMCNYSIKLEHASFAAVHFLHASKVRGREEKKCEWGIFLFFSSPTSNCSSWK